MPHGSHDGCGKFRGGEADPDFDYVYFELPERKRFGWVRREGRDQVWLSASGEARMKFGNYKQRVHFEFHVTMVPVGETGTKAGHQVFCGTLFDAAYPSGYFDVVRLEHSLEHMHDPLETLASMCVSIEYWLNDHLRKHPWTTGMAHTRLKWWYLFVEATCFFPKVFIDMLRAGECLAVLATPR